MIMHQRCTGNQRVTERHATLLSECDCLVKNGLGE
jgi:hypothetical protein